MQLDELVTTGVDEGLHDFDFFFGTWHQANRKRVRPLVEGDTEWVEFESWTEAGPILSGAGNIDTFKAPDFPGRHGFEGFSLRLYHSGFPEVIMQVGCPHLGHPQTKGMGELLRQGECLLTPLHGLRWIAQAP